MKGLESCFSGKAARGRSQGVFRSVFHARFVLLLAGAVGIGFSASVSAQDAGCECAPNDLPALLDAAGSVFAGEVIDVERTGSFVSARLLVEQVWKGPIAGALRVYTRAEVERCGVEFEVGERWLVFAERLFYLGQECELEHFVERGELSTDVCAGTRLVDDADLAVLGPPVWSAPPRAFVRGDSDGSGSVDITDAVTTLRSLFAGHRSRTCGDALDANDDGAIDIADAIFTLGWLFLEGDEPPAPGPLRAGFDPTTDDSMLCGDDTGPICEGAASSTLPGVRLEWIDGPCTLSLAEAAAGVLFTYRVVVEEPVVVKSEAHRICVEPGVTRLFLLERIVGGRSGYCLCDVGICDPWEDVVEVSLEPGSAAETFGWCGRQWFGPSDTSNPVGDPLPPGRYTISVRGDGTYTTSDGEEERWELEASYEFELVP